MEAKARPAVGPRRGRSVSRESAGRRTRSCSLTKAKTVLAPQGVMR